MPDGTTAHVSRILKNEKIFLTLIVFQVQLAHEGGSVHTLAELATSDTAPQEIQTSEGHILLAGDDGNTIPVQVSGGQFVTIPVNSSNYQTVVANAAGDPPPGGGQQLVHVNAPIQISGLQHLVMKTEPGEAGPGGVAGSLAGQHFSVLQMGDGGHQIITIRQRSPDTRESPDSNAG